MNLKLLSLPVLAVASALLLAVPSDAAGPGKAPKATFVKGDVTAAGAKVKRGAELAPGSTVKTGADSRAELTFPDGSVVRIGPSSELKLEAAAYDGKTKETKVEATLVGGQAWAKVSKLVGDDSKFNVKTQNAVAGVRGTIFRVNVDKDDATVVKVYNGAVAVAAPVLAGPDNTANTGPIASDRKPIPPPFSEVDVKTFEVLLGKMMQVKVTKAGVQAAAPTPFTEAEDSAEEPEWVRWNSTRDAGKDTEKSD
jgi:hypothetical protein